MFTGFVLGACLMFVIIVNAMSAPKERKSMTLGKPSPFVIVIRPARYGFIGQLRSRGAAYGLESWTWRPTLKWLSATLTRRRLRLEAAEYRRSQEKVIDP